MLPSRLTFSATVVSGGAAAENRSAAVRRSGTGRRAARTNGRISSSSTGVAVSASCRVRAVELVEVAGERPQVVERRARGPGRTRRCGRASRSPGSASRAAGDRPLHVRVLLGDRAERAVRGRDELGQVLLGAADRRRQQVEVVDQPREVLLALRRPRELSLREVAVDRPEPAEQPAEVPVAARRGPRRRRRPAASDTPGCRSRARARISSRLTSGAVLATGTVSPSSYSPAPRCPGRARRTCP